MYIYFRFILPSSTPIPASTSSNLIACCVYVSVFYIRAQSFNRLNCLWIFHNLGCHLVFTENYKQLHLGSVRRLLIMWKIALFFGVMPPSFIQLLLVSYYFFWATHWMLTRCHVLCLCINAQCTHIKANIRSCSLWSYFIISNFSKSKIRLSVINDIIDSVFDWQMKFCVGTVISGALTVCTFCALFPFLSFVLTLKYNLNASVAVCVALFHQF